MVDRQQTVGHGIGGVSLRVLDIASSWLLPRVSDQDE